jgi:hypothetical protein
VECQEDSPLRPFGTKRTLVCLIGILNIPSITIALPTRRGMELVLLHHFCDESSVAFTYSGCLVFDFRNPGIPIEFPRRDSSSQIANPTNP